jgi:Protein of unknown function (DUF3224)
MAGIETAETIRLRRGEILKMTAKATAKFQMKAWDENPYAELQGSKRLVRSSMNGTYEGDVSGDSSTEFLMAYSSDDLATYVGIERVEGSVDGRSGVFVMQIDGTFAEGVAKHTSKIIAGAGTGDLAGLRGQGTFEAPMGQTAETTLDYDFE